MKNIKTTINEQDYLNDPDYYFGLAADHGETVRVTTDSRHDVGICPAESLNPYHDSLMETILIYAVRYALCENNYTPKLVHEHIERHIGDISDFAMITMLNDIEEIRQTDKYAPFRKLKCFALEEMLIAERKRRNGETETETAEDDV